MCNVSKTLLIQSCTVNRRETRLTAKCAFRLFHKFAPFLNFSNCLFYKPCKSRPMFTFFLWRFSLSCMSPFAAEATFQLCHFFEILQAYILFASKQVRDYQKGFFLSNDLFVFLRSLHFSFRHLKWRPNDNRIVSPGLRTETFLFIQMSHLSR